MCDNHLGVLKLFQNTAIGLVSKYLSLATLRSYRDHNNYNRVFKIVVFTSMSFIDQSNKV